MFENRSGLLQLLALFCGGASGALGYAAVVEGNALSSAFAFVFANAVPYEVLSDDPLRLSLPVGLIFGIIGAAFGRRALGLPWGWAAALPFVSIGGMHAAQFAAIFAYDDGPLTMPFAIGSLVGSLITLLPSLFVLRRAVWGKFITLSVLPTAVAAVAVSLLFDSNDWTVFLPLFATWQALTLWALAHVATQGTPR